MNCYKGYYDIYNQNASTLTSLGNSSVNGSLTPASCEQRQDHDVSSFPPIHRCIKFANDQQVVGEVKELLSNGADPNSTESSKIVGQSFISSCSSGQNTSDVGCESSWRDCHLLD